MKYRIVQFGTIRYMLLSICNKIQPSRLNYVRLFIMPPIPSFSHINIIQLTHYSQCAEIACNFTNYSCKSIKQIYVFGSITYQICQCCKFMYQKLLLLLLYYYYCFVVMNLIKALIRRLIKCDRNVYESSENRKVYLKCDVNFHFVLLDTHSKYPNIISL